MKIELNDIDSPEQSQSSMQTSVNLSVDDSLSDTPEKPDHDSIEA